VSVIVAGQLPREPQNAPLHLFSASPELVGFGQAGYRKRSQDTSGLLVQLFNRFKKEGFTMAFTMQDFRRQFVKEHFADLPPEEQQELLKSLPPEARLAGLSAEQIRQYLDHLTANRPAEPRKPRRKKNGRR